MPQKSFLEKSKFHTNGLFKQATIISFLNKFLKSSPTLKIEWLKIEDMKMLNFIYTNITKKSNSTGFHFYERITRWSVLTFINFTNAKFQNLSKA